jgi:hypothetical protein
MEKILTIGIPTYKRPHSCAKLLNQILNSQILNDNVKVIVVNDSGSEEFEKEYATIINSYDGLDINYLTNVQNIGFPKSLLKLFSFCETKYLMMMADDDMIVIDFLEDILRFLNEKKPDLLSPQWLYRNGRFGRGIDVTRKVEIEEHRLCSGHAPGVIFNIENVREFIPIIEKRINIGCAATLTYPLVSFAISLILKNDNCWWYGEPIAMEGDNCESGIKDEKGDHYSSVNSRIQQIAAFDDFILTFEDSQIRNKLLLESRAWSIQKLLNSNKELKTKVLDYIDPSFTKKVYNKILKTINKLK